MEPLHLPEINSKFLADDIIRNFLLFYLRTISHVISSTNKPQTGRRKLGTITDEQAIFYFPNSPLFNVPSVCLVKLLLQRATHLIFEDYCI